MRGLCAKLLLAALCAALGASDAFAAATGAPAVGTLVALLCAVCAASLGEWLLGAYPAGGRAAADQEKFAGAYTAPRFPIAAIPGVVFSLCTFVYAPFVAILPVVAFDGARTLESGVCGKAFQLLRFTWVAPLIWWAFRVHGEVGELTALAPIALLCVVAWAWGASFDRAERLLAALRRTQDSRRGMVRDLKVQLDDSQEARLAAVHEARLQERTRIARDIHDNVGHLLTRAIMQTEAARVVAEARVDGTAADGLAQISATVNEAMTMVRRSVHDLDDAGQDFADLIRMATCGNGANGPEVTLRNTVRQAPAAVGRCFAAIIREALTNATRHGHALHVTVSVQDFPAFWQLVVQDDGMAAGDSARAGSRIVGVRGLRGSFGSAIASDVRGMGLADIDARVAALGGVSTHGPHGSGWRVFASIPKNRFDASFDTRSTPADD